MTVLDAPTVTVARVDAAIASALQQAVWDLEARRAGVPVWTALEGDAWRGVSLYANINRRTVDRSSAGCFLSATEAAAAGFRAFKIAPFDDVTPQDLDTPEGRDHVRTRRAARLAAR